MVFLSYVNGVGFVIDGNGGARQLADQGGGTGRGIGHEFVADDLANGIDGLRCVGEAEGHIGFIEGDETLDGKILTPDGTEFDSNTGILTLKSKAGTNDIDVQFNFNFGTF